MNEIKWRRKTKDVELQQKLKRRALLDVAAHSFSEKGYAKTSLDDLARTMNITKPALYYYVKNKEDILLQCTEISLDFVRAALLAANEGGGTGVERLRTFFRKYSQHVTGDYGYSLIREGEKHLNGKRKSELFSHLRAGQEVLMEIIALGIADGTIAPCRAKHVAYILFSTFNQMPVWYDPFGPLSISELTDQLLDLVMRGLEPR